MAYTNTWNNSEPLGSVNANTLDTIIQDLKLDIQERLISLGSTSFTGNDPVYFTKTQFGGATPKILGTSGVTTSIQFRDAADSQTNVEIFDNGDVDILGDLTVSGGLAIAGTATTLSIPFATLLKDRNSAVDPVTACLGNGGLFIGPSTGTGTSAMIFAVPTTLPVGAIITNAILPVRLSAPSTGVNVSFILYKAPFSTNISAAVATKTTTLTASGMNNVTFAVDPSETIVTGYSYWYRVSIQVGFNDVDAVYLGINQSIITAPTV